MCHANDVKIPTLVLGLITAICVSPSLKAAITLDDFGDDLHIDTPEQQDEMLTTSNVGPFRAERSVGVYGSSARVTGILDINSLFPSQATLTVESVTKKSFHSLIPRVLQQFAYEFPAFVDLTQNAEFDAFFIDFSMKRGPLPPRWLRLLVQQDVGTRRTFWAQWMPFSEERLEPFTAVFPFAGFHLRGGGPLAPPFTSVPELEVALLSAGGEGAAQWELRLDSIRLGALPAADYNGNGTVEQGDLDLVLLNWGSSAVPQTWLNDLPTGPIDQSELDEVLLHWGDRVTPPSVHGAAAIPEPGSLALAACAVAGTCIAAAGTRIRRRRC